MNRTRGQRRARGVTLVELLVVLGIAGLVAGLGAPTYLGWRADALNAEAVRWIETAIATGRTEAKRRGGSVTFALVDGASTFASGQAVMEIPHGGTLIVADSPSTLSFRGAFAAQEPFAPVVFRVRTGAGWSERTATLTVIPPLGKTAVAR